MIGVLVKRESLDRDNTERGRRCEKRWSIEGSSCRARNAKDSCDHHQPFPRNGKGKFFPGALRGSIATLTP